MLIFGGHLQAQKTQRMSLPVQPTAAAWKQNPPSLRDSRMEAGLILASLGSPKIFGLVARQFPLESRWKLLKTCGTAAKQPATAASYRAEKFAGFDSYSDVARFHQISSWISRKLPRTFCMLTPMHGQLQIVCFAISTWSVCLIGPSSNVPG